MVQGGWEQRKNGLNALMDGPFAAAFSFEVPARRARADHAAQTGMLVPFHWRWGPRRQVGRASLTGATAGVSAILTPTPCPTPSTPAPT